MIEQYAATGKGNPKTYRPTKKAHVTLFKRQKNSIKKYFYKIMNNSNFGYDCRNNLDNCQFVPIFNELKEITYLKRHYNYFDSKVSSFVTADLIKQEVQEKYNDLKMKLSKDDKFC